MITHLRSYILYLPGTNRSNILRVAPRCGASQAPPATQERSANSHTTRRVITNHRIMTPPPRPPDTPSNKLLVLLLLGLWGGCGRGEGVVESYTLGMVILILCFSSDHRSSTPPRTIPTITARFLQSPPSRSGRFYVADFGSGGVVVVVVFAVPGGVDAHYCCWCVLLLLLLSCCY